MEKIIFTTDDGMELSLFVLSDTRVGGVNYLLVADGDIDDEETQAYILKDVSSDSDTQSNYEMVEDDDEFDAVAKMFQDDLDEIDLQ